MKMFGSLWIVLAVAILAGGAWAAEAPREQAPPADAPKQSEPPPRTPEQPGPSAEAREVWPASLQSLAGRYVFARVASPGGIWERLRPSQPDARTSTRQVSIDDLPAPLRERLTHAEIIISDLKLPSEVEFDQRTSPSGRGKLRSYYESAIGRLAMCNVPGIGAESGDSGEFEGPVRFTIEHFSHSNPSVSGVHAQRVQQEGTWGAAALDYADLGAIPLAEDGSDGPGERAPIANARILRSGVEIFAYLEVVYQAEDGEHHYSGCLRLVRDSKGSPSPDPEPPRRRPRPLGPSADV
ncbi:MAG: hypothetical protein HY321_12055 [Armatimonadetes bacterium]|nr:hypothetical protein [Armatimonadota bacterium]